MALVIRSFFGAHFVHIRLFINYLELFLTKAVDKEYP